MKILKLTLSKKPFEVMVTGEKTDEFRKFSKWIESRMFEKNGHWKRYDFVHFTWGYGKDRPYFIAKYFGATKVTNEVECDKFIYSNGLKVQVCIGDFIIHLGDIIEIGNYQ